MENTWFLVANASSARLYQGDPRRKLELLKEFSHPASRERASALVSDRPGHNPGAGNGHGSFVPASDPKQNEASQFASELVGELEKGRVGGVARRIVLVAAPSFLGLLNKQLSEGCRALVTTTVQKDYTKADDKELQGHLAQALFS
jgi:protein required for attachment to host cells